MAATLQQVQARIAQVQATLPPGTNVTAERLNPSVFPVMGYSLYSKTVSPQELRRLALYTLRPRLLRVPGVREIAVLGGDTPDFLVAAQPDGAAGARRHRPGRGERAGEEQRDQRRSATMTSRFCATRSSLPACSERRRTSRTSPSPSRTASRSRSARWGRSGRASSRTRSRPAATADAAVLLNIIKQPTGNTVQVADGIKTDSGRMPSRPAARRHRL